MLVKSELSFYNPKIPPLPLQNELLSQQMEQLLKLEANLKQEKFQVDLLNEEVIHLKEELDKKSFMLELRTKAKTNELNTDIRNLQFECERMKDKISGFKKKSGYKSPENSIKSTKPDVPESNQNKSLTLEGLNASSSQIKNTSETKSIKSITLNPGCSSSENANLMAEEDAGMEPDWEEVISDEKWSCSQCTFANHPCLDTCEMCSMPRIKSTPDNSTNSLCTVHNHPQTDSPCYQNQSRSKIFSLPKLRRSGDNTE